MVFGIRLAGDASLFLCQPEGQFPGLGQYDRPIHLQTHGKYAGKMLSLIHIFMNPYDTIIKDIMDENIIYAVTTEDREDVVETFNKYDLLCLPVVDHEDRLVGIVTVDDAVEVMEQEATEDFEKMAAMFPSEKPYLRTGVLELAKNRIQMCIRDRS